MSDVAAARSNAGAARTAVVGLLADAGVTASSDGGSFYPFPVGVLVGLPSLVGRGLASRTFEVPVTIVSGEPLNTELAVERLYALADDVALALRVNTYSPGSYRGGVNQEPLPAIAVVASLTITEQQEASE